ncbi:lipoate--protein ligase [Furfurilactobacillus siliginis]|uniref:lipoate--protein ligase n=1 Tax=Furfurilactobacillus siliginis TaxID=348151 RepID=A0A0R2LDL3_9LACO|nr:lipoate--protein ligase [Furfurilactobacillus siliginis]KRN97114.1 lipoate-protein ligase A [Furfurilactobacillus siliginis]GEK29394.1 lipoate--protein ligase [Furfurilactobacillus siliginis]
MRYLASSSLDIRENLAIETYLMEHANLDEPILYFYINSPCIIVGRYQNVLEEINQQYVKDHKIILTRRTSGGGAVYDDLGNVSFSFITKDDGDAVGNFKRFTDPVITALHEMGATGAAMTGRNDLTIDGKKFSGNAMHVEHGRMFSHGTLMYDVDQSVLTKALNVPADKIASKGIKSVRSRVTNLKPHFDAAYQNLTIEAFRDTLAKKILNLDDLADARVYELDDAAQIGIQALSDRYFKNWNWIYGQSPAFSVTRRQHFPAGTVMFSFDVDEGKLTSMQISGDFFGQADIQDVEQALIGTTYEQTAVTNVFSKLDIPRYFGKITIAELVSLLMEQGTTSK